MANGLANTLRRLVLWQQPCVGVHDCQPRVRHCRCVPLQPRGQPITRADPRDFSGARQVIGDYEYSHHRASFDRPVRRPAYSIASSKLASLAVPLPAWSNAVPWSTLARMIGRPSETLMPFTLVQVRLAGSKVKPRILTGMCP